MLAITVRVLHQGRTSTVLEGGNEVRRWTEHRRGALLDAIIPFFVDIHSGILVVRVGAATRLRVQRHVVRLPNVAALRCEVLRGELSRVGLHRKGASMALEEALSHIVCNVGLFEGDSIRFRPVQDSVDSLRLGWHQIPIIVILVVAGVEDGVLLKTPLIISLLLSTIVVVEGGVC